MRSLIVGFLLIASAFADTAKINGIDMYYELHGKTDGTPLVLLHGGGSTIDVTWGRILPYLAKEHRIIAIEEQGHGRTSDRNAPVSFETSSEDVASLLKHLNITQADIFGFSNGASVAMMVAINHPALVRKLVYASSITKKSGAYPWFWEFMNKKANFENMPAPLKAAFLKVNNDPIKLRTMHDKDLARMQKFKDIPDSKVKSIKAETLIMFGDHDLVKPEHGIELTRFIKNSRLMILPGAHGEFLGELITGKPGSEAPEATAIFINEFLSQGK